jgi:hypothetical protein
MADLLCRTDATIMSKGRHGQTGFAHHVLGRGVTERRIEVGCRRTACGAMMSAFFVKSS